MRKGGSMAGLLRSMAALLVVLLPLGVYGQKIQKVCGEYTYYAEADESANEAKMRALEGARLQAIAAEFGTVIAQSTMQSESLSDGKERSWFSQLSSSEVKGEWLEDVEEPVYEITYVQDMLVVKCSVCGRARETSNLAAEFDASVLRNGTEKKFSGTDFRGGDDMYLYFQAPTDGYIAVYLVDEAPDAYCLLPYASDSDGQQPVEAGKEYVFFSAAKAVTEKELVDEYTLTCSNDVERNRLYVIYSKQPFTKAMDTKVSETLPKQLCYEDFSRWLTRRRTRDPEMGVKVMHIEIRK